MSYAYSDEEVITLPIPTIPGWGMFLDLFGQLPMRGPLRIQSGAVNRPSITYVGDPGTGIFQSAPFHISFALFHMLRFDVGPDGTTYYNEYGFGGTIAAELLSAARTYQLPNRSGTLQIENVAESASYMTVLVSNFAVKLLDANPNRVGVEIVNNGDSIPCFLGHSSDVVPGDVAAANGGKIITPKGSWTLEAMRWLGEVWAITAASSTIVSVTEYTNP